MLEKFADYWNAANIHVDRVVFRPIVESTVRPANLKAGSLEMIERALATDLPEIKADPKLKLATVPELGYQGVTLNIGKSDAGKSRLRQGSARHASLRSSLDREAITKVAFNGEFLPGNQWVSPKSPYYQGKFPVPKTRCSQGQGAVEGSGVTTPLAIDFMVPNNPETRQVAEIIQAMAGEAGSRHQDPGDGVRNLAQGGRRGSLPGLYAGLVGPRRPGRQFLQLLQDRGAAKLCRLQQPEVDAWLDERARRAPFAERKAVYEKIAEKALAEGGIVYLYHRLMIIAHTGKLDGYKQMPDGLIRLTGVKLKP